MTTEQVIDYGFLRSGVFKQASRGFRVDYTAPANGLRELKCGFVVDVKTQPTTATFEWSALFSMSNYANQGEDVACYAKGYKYASGPTWAGCFEAKDFTNSNSGALYGLEVDVWANGPGNGSRFGTQYNFGNATGGVKPTIDYGVDMAPSQNNRDAAQLAVALSVALDCADAVVKVRNGAVVKSLIDVTEAGTVGAILGLGSSNPLFIQKPLGPYIGKLRIRIDGADYFIPVYG